MRPWAIYLFSLASLFLSIKSILGCGEKGTLLYFWWDYKLVQQKINKLVQLLWRTAWRFLKKLKIELPYDPAIPLLGIWLEKMKALIWKDICMPVFLLALFTIAKTWEQPKCPSTDELIEKMGTPDGILLSHKKNEIMSWNMDEPRDYHTEWSKSDKGKYNMISVTYGI